jgi:hypothetical protein
VSLYQRITTAAGSGVVGRLMTGIFVRSCRDRGCFARFMDFVRGFLIGLERPFDVIIRSTMAMHATAMVEDFDYSR